MAWFLYVVECSDGTLYAGITTEIERRLQEHNTSAKGARYTRARRPVRLLQEAEFESRSQASKAEYYFKRLTRTRKEEWVTEPFDLIES